MLAELAYPALARTRRVLLPAMQVRALLLPALRLSGLHVQNLRVRGLLRQSHVPSDGETMKRLLALLLLLFALAVPQPAHGYG